MLDDISPFDLTANVSRPVMQRTRGAAECTFKVRNGKTVLDNLRQSGSFKIRIPKTPTSDVPEAVLLNTAGGLTGGDKLAFHGAIAADGDAIFTTQASERAYRSLEGDAEITTTLSIGERSRLAWLPQETIMFEGARLARTFDVHMATDAVLLAHESIVFGRTAMDEVVRTGSFRDSWKIYRDDTLIHADAMRVSGDIETTLGRAATLNGATAMATILYIGPDIDEQVEMARYAMQGIDPDTATGGVSGWAGKLICRIVARDGASLRRMVIPVLETLNDGRALPRVWNI